MACSRSLSTGVAGRRVLSASAATCLLIALSACDGGAKPDAATDAEPAASAAADGGEPKAAPTTGPTASDATDEMVQTIPAPLQGRWGMTQAACTAPKSDATAILTIGSDSLTFYEAVGTLKSVKSRDASHIVATFAFTGEGMTWEREENLSVSGTTLTRKATADAGQPGRAYTYQRCAA